MTLQLVAAGGIGNGLQEEVEVHHGREVKGREGGGPFKLSSGPAATTEEAPAKLEQPRRNVCASSG